MSVILMHSSHFLHVSHEAAFKQPKSNTWSLNALSCSDIVSFYILTDLILILDMF